MILISLITGTVRRISDMNEPIVVDVGWYRLVVDPAPVLIFMNLRDFKKMLRICCNVLPDHDAKVEYLNKWNTFLLFHTEFDSVLRSKRSAAVQERRNKL